MSTNNNINEEDDEGFNLGLEDLFINKNYQSKDFLFTLMDREKNELITISQSLLCSTSACTDFDLTGQV